MKTDVFNIRPYHPSDLAGLYRICLLTGNNGEASGHICPDLFGHYYAAPYAVYEPELCFMLTHTGTPCGYILGTKNTPLFNERCEQDWFPLLRKRYPLPAPDDNLPDAHIIRAIHSGFSTDDDLAGYPAHLHIDLLPVAQGQKLGPKLLEIFLNQLQTLGVPALHLEVGKENPRAIKFYERVGFYKIKEYDDGIAYGMRL